MNKNRKTINVGLVGAGWIGGVHSECFKRVEYTFGLDPGTINLYRVADMDEKSAVDVAKRYGYKSHTAKWEDVINDPEVDLIDICVTNALHYDISLSAAKTGKHIICEKPLSMDIKQAEEMVDAVKKYNVKNMINYNYRKVPAIVYIKELIDSGSLGEIFNYRSFIAQDFAADPNMPFSWRFVKSTSGGGSLITLGNHVFDMARFLVGEVDSVVAEMSTPIKKRPVPGSPDEFKEVDVDDLAAGLVKFKNGCLGLLESCWLIHGRKHFLEIEVYGSKGSVIFVSERLNELLICESSQPKERKGFKNVLIGQNHPYGDVFNLKTGMGIGIKESFVIQFYDFIRSIIDNGQAQPDFIDGLEAQKISCAFEQSFKESKWIKV